MQYENKYIDRIEAISYFCHIILPFIFLKTKYVEFINLEMKIKSYVPTQTPITKYIKLPIILENNKIFKI